MSSKEQDLSMRQLAEITGMHIETIRSLARDNKIPGVYKLGGVWRISQEALNTLRNIDDEGRV